MLSNLADLEEAINKRKKEIKQYILSITDESSFPENWEEWFIDKSTELIICRDSHDAGTKAMEKIEKQIEKERAHTERVQLAAKRQEQEVERQIRAEKDAQYRARLIEENEKAEAEVREKKRQDDKEKRKIKFLEIKKRIDENKNKIRERIKSR